MKYCIKCGNALVDDACFCDKCGARMPERINPQATPAQQPAPQANYSQPVQSSAQAPQQPRPAAQNPRRKPKKKKKNTGAIIAVIAVVAILLASIGSCSEKKFQEQGYGQDDSFEYTPYDGGDSYEDSDDSFLDTIIYTKGAVENGSYINKWANMRFDIGNEWTEGTYDQYAAFEGDGKTECGLLLSDEVGGKQLTIGFEKLDGVNLLISEDEYLDVVVDGMKNQFTGTGLTCIVSDYYDYPVANKTFRSVKISFEGVGMVQQIHVCNYDGYMIFVMAMAQSEYDAISTVNDIVTAE